MNGGTSTWQNKLCMYVTAWLEFFLDHRINAERKAIMIWRALSLVLAFSWLHCSHLHCTDWLNTDVCVCMSWHTVRLKTGGTWADSLLLWGTVAALCCFLSDYTFHLAVFNTGLTLPSNQLARLPGILQGLPTANASLNVSVHLLFTFITSITFPL